MESSLQRFMRSTNCCACYLSTHLTCRDQVMRSREDYMYTAPAVKASKAKGAAGEHLQVAFRYREHRSFIPNHVNIVVEYKIRPQIARKPPFGIFVVAYEVHPQVARERANGSSPLDSAKRSHIRLVCDAVPARRFAKTRSTDRHENNKDQPRKTNAHA